MKLAKNILAILFLLSLFIPSQGARADVSPPPAPQLGGLEPFQYQKTNVQMVYERVEMEIQASMGEDTYDYPGSRVNVTAYFTMHNTGNFPESMQVIFPLESFSNCRMGYGGGNSYTHYFVREDSFEAVVDGAIVSIQKVVTDHPYKVIPMDGVCDEMNWAGFNVTFPVGEDLVIRVRYVMEADGADSMQNIEYILETGAGWAGPIERGYVIVKFPYAATRENVLSESTTPGYQFLYNEIFWSFGDLEPTDENNINVSIVSPFTWEKILSLRRSLKENPELPEDWISLAQIYNDISTWHGSNLRNSEYRQKVSSAYEQAVQGNPDSADIFADYAQFVFEDCCFYTTEQLPASKSKILTLLNRALALDPKNEIALSLIDSLRSVDPGFEYTPPPTIPPTPTSLYTATPSVTPTIAPTHPPLPQPIIVTSIVTVVHTKIVEAPTSSPAPSPTFISSPTQIESLVEEKSITPTFIFGGLVIFVAGIGAGVYFSKRK